MPSVTSDDVFPYLVAGIVEAAKNNFRYPFPSLFQQAINKLTVLQAISKKNITPKIPTEMKDLLAQFEDPLDEWWPGDLPENVEEQFGSSATLLYEKQPEAWLWEYLEEIGASTLSPESLQYFQADIDQSAMKEVLRICRSADPQLTDVYTTVRRFLVEHPWTTLSELQQKLGRFPQLPIKLINSFYDPPDTFRRYTLHEGKYWLCPHCNGILNWTEDEKPYCARHSVCGRKYPDYYGRQAIDERMDLLRLNWGTHRRTCIPGIPELGLFRWLLERKHKSSQIEDVLLWPGVDEYDIQIRFTNKEVWAVDVKDYDSPAQLYHKLCNDKLPNAGKQAWQKGFYVVPQYRLNWNSRYIEQFKLTGNKKVGKPRTHANVQVLGEEQFRQRVNVKIRQIKAQSEAVI